MTKQEKIIARMARIQAFLFILKHTHSGMSGRDVRAFIRETVEGIIDIGGLKEELDLEEIDTYFKELKEHTS